MANLASAANPCVDAGRREMAAMLDAALAKLPSVLRQAVVLRHLEGWTQAEAAAIAGCPQGTIAWRTSEGLARLRRRMRPPASAAIVQSVEILAETTETPLPPRLLEELARLGRQGAAPDARVKVILDAYETFRVRRSVGWALAGVGLLLFLTMGVARAVMATPDAPSHLGGHADGTEFAPPCDGYEAAVSRNPESLPSGRAGADLTLALRRHAEFLRPLANRELHAIADGIVKYADDFANKAPEPPLRLVVIEHPRSNTEARSAVCSIWFFDGDLRKDIIPGAHIIRGQVLGAVRTVARPEAEDAPGAWFALHESSYRHITPGFLEHWRHEAMAAARDANIEVQSESAIAIDPVDDAGAEASAQGRLIVNIALVRSFCLTEPQPAPLADWCFGDREDPLWRSPTTWLKEHHGR